VTTSTSSSFASCHSLWGSVYFGVKIFSWHWQSSTTRHRLIIRRALTHWLRLLVSVVHLSGVRPSVCHILATRQGQHWRGRAESKGEHRHTCLYRILNVYRALIGSRAFQFGQKSFDSILATESIFFSIRFGNLINLPLVHWYSNSKLGVIFIVCIA